MEIAAVIIFLFVDMLTFDATHEAMGIDPTQPVIGMAVEQVCEAGGGTYDKWGDPSVSCQGFIIPRGL